MSSNLCLKSNSHSYPPLNSNRKKDNHQARCIEFTSKIEQENQISIILFLRERNSDYIWSSPYASHFDKVGTHAKWWGVLYHKPRLVYISILWLDKIHNTLFYLGDFWSTWCTTANLEFAHAISHYKMMILQLWHYRIYRTRNNKIFTIFPTLPKRFASKQKPKKYPKQYPKVNIDLKKCPKIKKLTLILILFWTKLVRI